MRILLITSIALAAALHAQGYTAGTVTNDFTAKEIYATGTHLRTLTATWPGYFGDSDEGHAEDYPIGFTFEYYGQAFTAVDICLNGWVSFSGITGQYPYLPTVPPASVPDAAYPNGEICVSYHNMFLYGMSSNSTDGMYAQTLGTAPNREFRVEWKTLRSWSAQGSTSVVLILYETTNRIEIHFDPGMALPPHATGIEDQAGTNGLGSAGGWMQLGPQADGYDFTPVAAGAPEVEVSVNSGAVSSGDALALGDAPDNLDFDIALELLNSGSADLNVSAFNISAVSNCSVTILGATVPAVITPAAAGAWTLRVTPAVPGAWSFQLGVDNDDADEDPFGLSFGGSFTATGGGGGGGGGVGGLDAGGGGGGSGCSAGLVNTPDLALLLLMALLSARAVARRLRGR
jgi:hypothetical protein